MKRQSVLYIDAAINLLLGGLLVVFPARLAQWLGLPLPPARFYVNILGAVFIGIAFALFLEARRSPLTSGNVGLGAAGAAAINLCGSLMLIGWLVAGQLSLRLPGSILLWGLALGLMIISLVELNGLAKADT